MNKRRRFKAKRRRRLRWVVRVLAGTPVVRWPQQTAEELWQDSEAVTDPNVIGAIQVETGDPPKIEWHPLSISLVDGVKRYQVDGFYWRPLTVEELFSRNDSGDWRGCRMIGSEPCTIDGIAPLN